MASRSLKTRHLYIVALIHLCNICGLVPVLYEVLKYCKGASILTIASSYMTLYMELLSICFRCYLCSIGFLSSPKTKIIMYFIHRLHLTSHIRGHLLSTQMALLHPSADIPYVGTQKDILGLKLSKTL